MDFKEITPAYRRGPTLRRLVVVGYTLGALGFAAGLVGLNELEKMIDGGPPSKMVVSDPEGSTALRHDGPNSARYEGINIENIFQPKKSPYIIPK